MLSTREADGGGNRNNKHVKTDIKYLVILSSAFLASCGDSKDWGEIRRVCNEALSAAKAAEWFPSELQAQSINLHGFDNRRCDFFFGETPESEFHSLDIKVSLDCFETVIDSEGCKIESATYSDFSLKPETRMCSTTLFGEDQSLTEFMGHPVESCPEDYSKYHYRTKDSASQTQIEELP